MPYTITTNTGKVDSLQIHKISLSAYANLVNSDSLNPETIYIVENFGVGGGGGTTIVQIATKEDVGVISVPETGSLQVTDTGELSLNPEIQTPLHIVDTSDVTDYSTTLLTIDGKITSQGILTANKGITSNGAITSKGITNTGTITTSGKLTSNGGITNTGTITSSGAVTINATTASSSTSTGALIVKGGIGAAGNVYASKVYGAVWNDYAEYRAAADASIAAGRVVKENGDDTVSLADGRLIYGCSIVSDTFGFAIGETADAQTPLAVSGRVLAYPWENREVFRHNIGRFVCSGPGGTVSIMEKQEAFEHPEAVIGSISSVPDYEYWNETIKVDGRVWIKLK